MNYSWSDPRRAEPVPARQAGSMCVVARAEALAGMDEKVEGLLADLAEEIRADEPGCLSYTVTRAMGSRTHFAVHARFTGWQAFRRHSVTVHMKRAMPLVSALLASAVSLEIFIEV